MPQQLLSQRASVLVSLTGIGRAFRTAPTVGPPLFYYTFFLAWHLL